ncbi:MAG: rRNA maturation RNase YbeY [Sphingobacteriales bacterium]|nr:MAG: rRNA maturation RNase YbeY [Sphingobacteriales bacterium]
MAVRYYEQEVKAGLSDRRKLSGFLQAMIRSRREHLKKLDLTYIFCDEAYLLEINRQYLNHDTHTDIITFDLSESEDHLQGEVYISVDMVQENAGRFNETYQQELHRVIFHGALHLCGLKDKKPEDQAAMRRAEDDWLAAYATGLAGKKN